MRRLGVIWCEIIHCGVRLLHIGLWDCLWYSHLRSIISKPFFIIVPKVKAPFELIMFLFSLCCFLCLYVSCFPLFFGFPCSLFGGWSFCSLATEPHLHFVPLIRFRFRFFPSFILMTSQAIIAKSRDGVYIAAHAHQYLSIVDTR